ncbi:hypothetical protein HPB52_009264 [Rhipicephalus sanguineus]|uniref:Uncharacterized protein n=1 Tax=Rhipicephalus sanguineus TaxID=34632 RepID=A0A9D4Q5Z2_RHISA|nr:hypothetical protein HPB52_009264 [Rhipicephalus sanguineus]
MDRLRCTRGVVRATATKLITSATEVLESENPSPTDLQVLVDDLQDKHTTLADLNQKIADITTDGPEYEEEVTMALDYHDKICNTMSRVRYLLKSAARPADGIGVIEICLRTGSGNSTSPSYKFRGCGGMPAFIRISLPDFVWLRWFL